MTIHVQEEDRFSHRVPPSPSPHVQPSGLPVAGSTEEQDFLNSPPFTRNILMAMAPTARATMIIASSTTFSMNRVLIALQLQRYSFPAPGWNLPGSPDS